jgi:hypothetical protein
MKKIGIILMALLLAAGLVLTGCASGGGAKAEETPTGEDPTTIKFRHFLGIYTGADWNATNSNEGILSNILDYTYTFVQGRKTADYVNYFILEIRDYIRVLPLNIKSITITAGSESIPLDLTKLTTAKAYDTMPVAPSTYENGVLSVRYPRNFSAGQIMPRIAVEIPENKRAVIAAANTVSVKIELAE